MTGSVPAPGAQPHWAWVVITGVVVVCGAFPPVDGFRARGHAVEDAGGELGVRAPAAGEAELPEFAGGAAIVVDRFVNGVGVDLAGAVAIDRCRDVAEQFGQLRLMVSTHAFARGVPFGLGAHHQDGTVFQPEGYGPRCLPTVTEAGAQITLLLRIADSARLLGDATSAVSVYRLCGSARVALGGPRRSPQPGSAGGVDAPWSRRCCIAGSARI